ncbi:endolytic transglycosylase MltG [Sphingomonas sp. ID0503]|uniref:endolytic transglycosylase MltG n=1 Tax=Sphingomonas sp. ID0503 TaxID=3399691 RepID=UPI003AFB19A5
MARRRKRGLGCGGLILILLAVLAVAVPALFWWGPGPLPRETAVQVPEGSTLGEAARRLEAAGAIRSANWFRRFAGRLGSSDPIKAGEFAIPARSSAATILDLLQHGRPIQRLVTIPEGTPSVLVADRLKAEKLLAGPVAVPPEGSVLPDSYDFERGEQRAAVLKRMTAAMTRFLDDAWRARKKTTAVRSKREAVTLASIVEKETAVASERRMVAGVYSNRLRIGMPLQADPTVIYPITKGRPLGRRIFQSELRAKNGYNTYAEAGLPRGPIANPGRASIEAVLDPAPTKALYFVADGKGGHVFATTLAEHNANVRKWYAIRRQRGEM